MKISRFNTFTPYKGNIVIYNSLWDSCMMTSPDNIIHSILKAKDNEKLSLLDEKALTYLLKNKFVISSSVNELDVVKSQLDTTNDSSDYYILTINPTLSCNFRCWYCYENHSGKKNMSRNDISSIIKLVETILCQPSIKYIHLNFFGGEPLLCFSSVVKPLIEAAKSIADLNKKKYFVSLTTNAFYLKEDYAKFFKKHNLYSYQITLDGNRVRHNQVRTDSNGTKSYDIIVHNIKYALSLNSNVIVRLNLSDETNLDVPLLLNDFQDLPPTEKSHLMFSVQKIWQASDSVNDTIKEVIDMIRRSGYNCQKFDISFRNIKNTCYSDKKHHIIINPNGEIYGCTARDFNEKTLEGKLCADGIIQYSDIRHKRMNTSPLSNSECRECKILPMCIGGCKQKLMENNDGKHCPYGFSESDKTKFAEYYVSERFI